MITGMEQAGVDHEALLDTYIRAINVVTQERPDDLTFSVHMCRGNYKASRFAWHREVSLSDFRRQGNTLFGGWVRANSHQALQHP